MSIVPTANNNANTNISNTNSATSNSNQHSNNNNSAHSNENNVNTNNNNKSSKEESSSQQFSNLSVSALSSSFLSKSPTAASQGVKNEANNVGHKTFSENSPHYELQENLKQSKNMANNFVYDDINIFMWSVCKICNKSTKKFAMSPHTWSFSLAKYLELTFHAKNYHQFNENNSKPVCTHSLFQDHYQYFRFRNIVTVFSTSKISIRLLQLPSFLLKSSVIWIFDLFFYFCL